MAVMVSAALPPVPTPIAAPAPPASASAAGAKREEEDEVETESAGQDGADFMAIRHGHHQANGFDPMLGWSLAGFAVILGIVGGGVAGTVRERRQQQPGWVFVRGDDVR